MSEVTSEIRLPHGQRDLARELWTALMFSTSTAALLEARQELEAASPEVRNAIRLAQIQYWRQGKEPTLKDPNPFE